jgi:hypothetical protein
VIPDRPRCGGVENVIRPIRAVARSSCANTTSTSFAFDFMLQARPLSSTPTLSHSRQLLRNHVDPVTRKLYTQAALPEEVDDSTFQMVQGCGGLQKTWTPVWPHSSAQLLQCERKGEAWPMRRIKANVIVHSVPMISSQKRTILSFLP